MKHCVFTACDRGWLPVFATMALSLSINSPGLELKLLFDGQIDEDVLAVREYVRGLGTSLDVIPAARFLAGIPEAGRLSRISCAKAFVSEAAGTDYARILYIDCDTLVLAPLYELLETPLRAAAAAVKDPGTIWRTEMTALQIPAGSFYFNSGVMLIDPVRWQEAGLSARFAALMRSRTFRMADQGALNHLLRDDQQMLDARWNCTWLTDPPCRDPAIMHFIGRKPWNAAGVWGEELFWAYQAKTPFNLRREASLEVCRPSAIREPLHRLLLALHVRTGTQRRQLKRIARDRRMWDRRMADRELMAALMARCASI